MAENKLVKMRRDDAEADVHPVEVENYELGGWVKIKPDAKPEAKVEVAEKPKAKVKR